MKKEILFSNENKNKKGFTNKFNIYRLKGIKGLMETWGEIELGKIYIL